MNKVKPGGAPETGSTDGGAIILTGHETTALPRRRGTLRSLWRTHRGRHGLAANPSIIIDVPRLIASIPSGSIFGS
jgi:hypothetical protein